MQFSREEFIIDGVLRTKMDVELSKVENVLNSRDYNVGGGAGRIVRNSNLDTILQDGSLRGRKFTISVLWNE